MLRVETEHDTNSVLLCTGDGQAKGLRPKKWMGEEEKGTKETTI